MARATGLIASWMIIVAMVGCGHYGSSDNNTGQTDQHECTCQTPAPSPFAAVRSGAFLAEQVRMYVSLVEDMYDATDIGGDSEKLLRMAREYELAANSFIGEVKCLNSTWESECPIWDDGVADQDFD